MLIPSIPLPRHYSRLRKFMQSRNCLYRVYYDENRELISEIVQDMLDNLMLHYIRPERYCHMLGVYMGCGMKIVAKLACVYLMEIGKGKAIPKYGTIDEKLFQVQHYCGMCIDFSCAMEETATIKFKLHDKSLSDSIEGLSTEKSDYISKISSHMEAVSPTQAEAIDQFICSQLSLRSIEIVYSSDNDGIAMDALLIGWQLCTGPHLFLIFSKPPYVRSNKVFGAYFDRAYREIASLTHSSCALLQADPHWKLFPHTSGTPLSVAISPMSIDIGDGALRLEVPLTDGSSVESVVFDNSPMYKKKNFDVFYIEIWRLAPG